MPKTNAIYARFSSHAQDDSSSIEIQVDHCTKTLGGESILYKDEAKTGRAIAGRRGLQQLLDDAKAGKIGKVCVWRFSRIGRNLAESAVTIQELEDHGVNVVSAMEGSDPLVRSIFLSMAEHYSRELATSTRDGLAARFKQRGFTGGVSPFGYRVVGPKDARKLEIDPDEAKTIKELVSIYLGENVGFKKLGRKMEQSGISTRTGVRWTHTTIRAILLNTILIGKPRFLRRQMKLNRDTGRRLPIFREEPEVLTYDDPSLRILTDEQFEKVQKLLNSRKNKTRTPQLPRQIRTFTGLAYCEECGAACYTCKSQNSKGTYYYLACGERCRQGKDACPNSGRIREDEVLAIIQSDYAELFDDSKSVISEAVREAKELSKDQQGRVVGLKAEIAAIDKQLSHKMRLLDDPDIEAGAKRAISRAISELDSQREQLIPAMAQLAKEAGENTDKLAKAVEQALAEARVSLGRISTPAEFNRWVSRFVGPFVVGNDGDIKQKALVELSHPTKAVAGGGFEPPTSGL